MLIEDRQSFEKEENVFDDVADGEGCDSEEENDADADVKNAHQVANNVSLYVGYLFFCWSFLFCIVKW